MTLGPGCRIGEGSRISNAILWENVTVGTGCFLANLSIADGVEGPDGTYKDEGVLA